jgi:Tfp pilus assembly protein PilN
VIRTNLSTRPFYNTQAVTLAVGVLGAIVVLAAIFNIVSIVRSSQSDSALATQAAQDSERAAVLRAESAKLRASVDPGQVDRLAGEARLANDLIDRRVFSWTELFNQFEATLPANVRITAVRPVVADDGRITLTVTIAARDVDDVNEFMENLEKTAAFGQLLAREERVAEDGQLEATLEALYRQSSVAAPAAAAATPQLPATSEPATASSASSAGGRP